MALQVIRVSIRCGDAVLRNRIRDALRTDRGLMPLDPEDRYPGSDHESPDGSAMITGTPADGAVGTDAFPDASGERAELLVLHTEGGLPAGIGTPYILVSSSPPRNPLPAAQGGLFRGWLPERFTGTELRAAVRAAASGLIVFHPAAGFTARAPENRTADGRGPGAAPPNGAARGFRDNADQQAVPFESREPTHPELTEREREVLVLLSSGYANAEIGRILSVSENTVKFHLQSIYRKLDVSGRAEAVLAGIRSGEIPL